MVSDLRSRLSTLRVAVALFIVPILMPAAALHGQGISVSAPKISIPSVPKIPSGVNLGKTPEWSKAMKGFDDLDKLVKQGGQQIGKQAADEMMKQFGESLKGVEGLKGKQLVTDNTLQMLSEEFASQLRNACPEMAEETTKGLLEKYKGGLKALDAADERPGLRPGTRRPALEQIKKQMALRNQALGAFSDLRRQLGQLATAKAEGQLNEWVAGPLVKSIEENGKLLNEVLDQGMENAETLLGEAILGETMNLLEEVVESCLDTGWIWDEVVKGAYTEPQIPDDAQKIPVRRHFHGADKGCYPKAACVVVQTAAEWNEFWRAVRGNSTVIPPFDEKRETALCALCGMKDTKNDTIRIEPVYKSGGGLIAVVRKSHGANEAQKKNSPYYVAVVDKFTGKISFAETE